MVITNPKDNAKISKVVVVNYLHSIVDALTIRTTLAIINIIVMRKITILVHSMKKTKGSKTLKSI